MVGWVVGDEPGVGMLSCRLAATDAVTSLGMRQPRFTQEGTRVGWAQEGGSADYEIGMGWNCFRSFSI